MAQPIKYNVGSITAGCSISKGNYDIGINTNYAYGPTASTGFWAGYPSGTTIPVGGFISYQNKASQGPSIYNIPTKDDLVYFGTQLDLPGILATPEEVIEACWTDNDIALVNIDYPEIPVDNNLLTLDAGYTASYPWMNLAWKNVSGVNPPQAQLTGSTSFATGSSGYNYSDSYINMVAATQNAMVLVPNFGSQLNTFTVNVWIYLNNGQGFDTRQNVVGQQYRIGGAPQTECNFLIRGNGINGFQGLIRSNSNDNIVDFGAISNDTIAMLTLTYDGNQLTAYRDGTQVTTDNIGALVTTNNGLQTIIGGNTSAEPNEGSAARYFDGGIYVVNIYDTALNGSQITDLYNLYSTQRGF
jgi:hypothetical protein